MALSGQAAPGTEDPYFDFLNYPVLSDTGQVAFQARLGTFSQSSGNGIWAEGTDGLSLVVRSGDAAPGNPSGIFGQFNFVSLTNNGQVLFADYAPLSGTFWGIWSKEGDDTLNRLVGTGDPVPGTGGSEFIRFRLAPSYNSVGNATFWYFVPPDPLSGLWAFRDGKVEALAIGGAPAPGIEGATFAGVTFPASIAEDDEVSFFAYVEGDGIDHTNNIGLWTEENGSLQLLARLGDPAPGVDGGVLTGFALSLVQYPDRPTAFRAALSDSMGSVDQTIWALRAGALDLVVRSGDVHPESGGEPFGRFTVPAVNNHGDIAFMNLQLMGRSPATGIWSSINDKLRLVVGQGDAVPGLDGFSFFLSNNSIDNPMILVNDAGYVAFTAGIGNETGVDQSIWVQDPTGVLHLIVREGSQLEVASGDVREIERLIFEQSVPQMDHGAMRFNDRGQLVFIAAFTDGTSGVFVSSPLVIPEPSALALAGFSLIAVLRAARPLNRPRRIRARAEHRGDDVFRIVGCSLSGNRLAGGGLAFMSTLTRCLLLIAVGFSCVEAPGQFTNVINSPPSIVGNDQWMDSNTQLNVFDGGSVGRNFGVGAADGSSINIELNVNGGTVGGSLTANGCFICLVRAAPKRPAFFE